MLLKYLGVISKSAAAIDKYLLNEVIGNFELLHYYHLWKSQPRHPRDASYGNVRALQRSFNRELMGTFSIEFCDELVKYYDGQ